MPTTVAIKEMLRIFFLDERDGGGRGSLSLHMDISRSAPAFSHRSHTEDTSILVSSTLAVEYRYFPIEYRILKLVDTTTNLF